MSPTRCSVLLAVLSVAVCDGPPEDRRQSADAAGVAVAGRELVGAGGARLHYRLLGTGPDTVVVVHGGPGAGMNSVLPDLAPLGDRLVLVFYDQRGGGRSELPADTSRLRARYFVEDLEAVRRHFGLERMNLLTHSFGSVLAARYAQAYPERVGRMVFHGATGPRREEAARIARATPPSPDSALTARADSLLRSLLAGSADDPVATCRRWEEAGRRLARARGETVRWEGTSCAASPEAVRYYFRHTAQFSPATFGDWDFTSGLERLAAPLLVVYGKRDSLAVPAQRSWAASVPNGRLLLVSGAGKAAIAERPDVVLPALRSFFAGEWPAGAEPVDE